MPLYQLMRKSDKFVWTPQADAAFHELKRMLATAPVLASPLSKEPMLLYIAATNRVVSAVVVVEREEEGKLVQRPVYYLSEVLATSKQNYPHYQKMTYGVYMVLGFGVENKIFLLMRNPSKIYMPCTITRRGLHTLEDRKRGLRSRTNVVDEDAEAGFRTVKNLTLFSARSRPSRGLVKLRADL